MQAAIIRDYEADIEIAEIDAAELRDDSVLIAVRAASLNPIDTILQSGVMRDEIPLIFPHVMGFDVAGDVIALGKDVEGLKKGDAVFARPNQDDAGALAQIARVKASELALKPTKISYEQAASIPLAGLTAWQALVTKSDVKKEDKVLIHAGSGGVGTLAIQIAKHLGAHIATTCSHRNADLVRKLGADVVIDYHDQRFEDAVSDYDVVFDMIGGDTLNRSFRVLKEGGKLISIKGQDSDNLAAKHGVKFDWFFMQPDGAMLSELSALLEADIVKPVIDSTYSLADIADAYQALGDGHAVGKIVVCIPDNTAA